MRVLIVDDHRLFGDAIHLVLADQGMEVVQATTGREALREIATGRVDVALVDLGLPDMTGIELGSRMLEAHPEMKVMALTALEDPGAVREAIQAGFRGYLTKDTAIPEFVELMNAIVRGQVIFPHRLGRTGAERSLGTDQDTGLLARHLTPREWDVLALLVEGMTSKEMMERMSISGNTVRTHVQNVLTKLQVHSRLEAASFAVRHGLIDKRRRLYA
jgi:two-component system nitrate/nitrite response regulator NarL